MCTNCPVVEYVEHMEYHISVVEYSTERGESLFRSAAMHLSRKTMLVNFFKNLQNVCCWISFGENPSLFDISQKNDLKLIKLSTYNNLGLTALEI